MHASFKPEQMESMNRDVLLQQQFGYGMNSYMKRVHLDQLVVAVPLLEDKQGYSLSVSEAAVYSTYITELISNLSGFWLASC